MIGLTRYSCYSQLLATSHSQCYRRPGRSITSHRCCDRFMQRQAASDLLLLHGRLLTEPLRSAAYCMPRTDYCQQPVESYVGR